MRWKGSQGGTDPIDRGVPDGVAVLDTHGQLIGWDEAAAHAYLAERGQRSARCDDDCAAHGHVEGW